MQLVALLRHGEEDGAADARAAVASRSRRGLSAAGRAQAAAARDYLSTLDAGRVACSDLPRAMETAEIVADGRPVDVVSGLAGLGLGEWEGRTAAELEHDLAAAVSDPGARPPGGESLADLLERARPAFLGALPEEGDAIVVGHRMVNAVLLAELIGLPLADAALVQQDPGAVSVLARRPSGRLAVQMLNISPLDPLRTSAVTTRG
jgi:broad specificity phosphatase PhoE